MEKPKLVIGVLNKNNNTDGPEKRLAIDKTWGERAESLGVPYVYIHGTKAKNTGKKIVDRKIRFNVRDGYLFLPSKVRAFCKFLIENAPFEWDYFFKCDDDTFVHVDRLQAFIETEVSPNGWDYVGCKVTEEGAASGGAGYILSRQAVEIIANSEINEGAEDVLVAEQLKNSGIELVNSQRFDPWGKNQPTETNDMITTHYIKPQEMGVIYRRFMVVEQPESEVVVEDVKSVEPKPKSNYTKPKVLASNKIPTGTIREWVAGGHESLRYFYPILRNSRVAIIGSNQHRYITEFLKRFPNTPNIYYFDPIPEFVRYLKHDKYRVKVQDTGVDGVEGRRSIFLHQEGTGFYTQRGPARRVACTKLSTFMNDRDIKEFDLLVLDCEGSEYGILEDLIETGKINSIRNLQVQFHNLRNVDWNCTLRREQIVNKLCDLGMVPTYSFPFVWEGFTW